MFDRRTSDAVATSPRERRSTLATGVAAATYTLVAAAQKASGFLVLLAFTRVLAPDDYGQIALLTTVGGLLLMVMTLGLEPRIMYAWFRTEKGLANYLRTAERVSIALPAAAAMALAVAALLLPLQDGAAWAMQCAGACLIAAGTTYPYAVLRASRRALSYAGLAVGILVVQVGGRIIFVAVLDLGPWGWALTELVSGLVAVSAGPFVVRRLRHAPDSHEPSSPWRVIRDGLPLVPHYLAQWGLALSDRLLLVLFVSTAAIGIYSAIYQIAAVISLVLSEVNRAFMPLYARHEPGAPQLRSLVGLHLLATFVIYGALFLGGFAAVHLFLPSAYNARAELYPVLALAALIYGLYFVPMNLLTLVAGVTRRAPLISLGGLAVNVLVNLSLDGELGLVGAAAATVAGYLTLAVLAVVVGLPEHTVRWTRVLADRGASLVVCLAVAGCSIATLWTGVSQVVGLAGTCVLLLTLTLLVSRTARTSQSVISTSQAG